MINPGQLKTKADWTAAGKRVFEEYDLGSFRHYEPEIIQEFHEATSQRLSRIAPRKDGTIPGARWVVSERGIALTAENCTQCHRRALLVERGANLDVQVKALLWGESFDWETVVFDVTPISYAQCCLYKQFHRREDDVYRYIAYLHERRYGTPPPIRNVPNRYLRG